MNDHGVEFEDRWPRLWETLEAMQALWTQEEATYKGKYVNFECAWCYPKPIQQPHPPILLGVFDSKGGRARVARYAQGWIPISFDLARTQFSMDDVRKRMEENGRDPSQLTTSILFLAPDTDEEMVREALDCGADRVILRVPTEDDATVLAFLNRYQPLTE
jgi:alkanesulfonate monooxygenase SsuD/methylene tetrahydromethanopterin reductase-like flavin-dependent oxidoreductase (luciferase family)